MAEAPVPVETWIVRLVGGDTAPFHSGQPVTIRQGPGNEVSLGLPTVPGEIVGTAHGPHLRFEVDDEKGPLLWRLSRNSGGAKDVLLGAVFRKERGEDATGVWVAEAGEGVDPGA